MTYAPEAREDIEAVRRWLTQPGSGPAARSTMMAIIDAIETLREHPCRFPLGRHRGVRERLCAGGWRVFYRVTPDTGGDDTAGDVRVLRVYGLGQDRRGFDGPDPTLSAGERWNGAGAGCASVFCCVSAN